MTDDHGLDLPEVVDFISEGIPCKAFVIVGKRGLNMRTCQIILDDAATINIEYLPDRTRVFINGGGLWFDTDSVSAARIEALFS